MKKWLKNPYIISVVGLLLIGLIILFWPSKQKDQSNAFLWETHWLVNKDLFPIGVDREAYEAFKTRYESLNAPDDLVPENMTYNPFTGLYVANENWNPRAIAVQYDNLFAARPQASLRHADVAFEMYAEGLITRYLAIFLTHYPDLYGSIRSSRPYFVEKALEFDPYYVHVGGSMQALSDIKKYQMADIDALSSGAFWRVSHKRAPHSTYSSSEVILRDAQRRGYREEGVMAFLDFNRKFNALGGVPAEHIKFVYKNPTQTDAIGYYTSYKYNSEDRLYYRYTNGKPHIDEVDEVQLTCSNILVQYAHTRVIDSEGRLEIQLVGSGNGKLYSAGEVIETTWSKENPSAPTYFFKLNGDPVKLNPGKTWVQVLNIGQYESIIE